MTDAAKTKLPASLRAVMAAINKDAPGTIIRGSDINYEKIPRITSGSVVLDVALGGGWAANQWMEIVGEFSSGKTALVLKTIAANQALDPEWKVWWVASETFYVPYAQMLGVDVSRVFVHDTNVAQDALQRVLEIAETREVDCIVIDSLPALIPDEETVKGMDEFDVATMAKLNNKFWRKQGAATRRSLTEEDRPITGFIINQYREKIGVMHGDPRTTPGGKGKEYGYFIKVETRRTDWITDGKEEGRDKRVGIAIAVTTIKNKSYRPGVTAEVGFYFADAEGHAAGSYDVVREARDMAIRFRIIEPHGAWYYYGDLKWNGKAAVYEAMEDDPKLLAKITEEVMAIVTQPKEPPPSLTPKKVVKAVKKASK